MAAAAAILFFDGDFIGNAGVIFVFLPAFGPLFFAFRMAAAAAARARVFFDGVAFAFFSVLAIVFFRFRFLLFVTGTVAGVEDKEDSVGDNVAEVEVEDVEANSTVSGGTSATMEVDRLGNLSSNRDFHPASIPDS